MEPRKSSKFQSFLTGIIYLCERGIASFYHLVYLEIEFYLYYNTVTDVIRILLLMRNIIKLIKKAS